MLCSKYSLLSQFSFCTDFRLIMLITTTTIKTGTRSGAVLKALRYKQAGRGFDSRWCH
jgi:hypothetical protein